MLLDRLVTQRPSTLLLKNFFDLLLNMKILTTTGIYVHFQLAPVGSHAPRCSVNEASLPHSFVTVCVCVFLYMLCILFTFKLLFKYSSN